MDVYPVYLFGFRQFYVLPRTDYLKPRIAHKPTGRLFVVLIDKF